MFMPEIWTYYIATFYITFSLACLAKDAALDKSIKLNITGNEMFQSFKASPFYSLLKKFLLISFIDCYLNIIQTF